MVAGLLGLVAAMFVISSFLTLVTGAYGGGSGATFQGITTAWSWTSFNDFRARELNLLGVLFVIAALAALTAAALSISGRAARSRLAHACTVLAVGLACGIGIELVVDFGSASLDDSDGLEYSLGPAFWILALIVPILLGSLVMVAPVPAALLLALPSDHRGRPVRSPIAGPELVAGLLLPVAAVLLVVATLVSFFGVDPTQWQFGVWLQLNGIPVLTTVAVGISAAVLLLPGRFRFARAVAVVAAAMIFALASSRILFEVSYLLGRHETYVSSGIGLALQAVVVLLAVAIMLMMVLAAGARPAVRASYPHVPQPNPYFPNAGTFAPAPPSPQER